MGRLVDAIVPARMGTAFRWLIASSWIGNLGDGIALAAGPLLIASQTQDPAIVAAAALLQRLRGCCSASTPACWPTGSTGAASSSR